LLYRAALNDQRHTYRAIDPVGYGYLSLPAWCLGQSKLGQELHLVEADRNAGEFVTGNPKNRSKRYRNAPSGRWN
jgi:hypothetical protein